MLKTNENYHIVVFDDVEQHVVTLSRMLENEGFEVINCISKDQLFYNLDEFRIDLILVNVHMKTGDVKEITIN